MGLEFSVEDIQKVGDLELFAKQLVEGFITGLHRSPYHGFSVEFAEHKLYNYGESTRHIDWKVFSKTDRLYSKRYEEETNLRCNILMDISSSMYYPSMTHGKIKFSILAAAALSLLLQKQRDSVGMSTFSDKIEFHSPTKSTTSHLHNLLHQYQKLYDENYATKRTNVADVLHDLAAKIHKRSLVIIFSDMLQNIGDQNEIFKALQHLKHRHHEVLIFHVHDEQTELLLDFEDRPYIFEDLETQKTLKLTPTEIKESYRVNINNLFHELKMKCGQMKIDFVDANIHDGFEKILHSYLSKRSRIV